jgi:hypothetical protein
VGLRPRPAGPVKQITGLVHIQITEKCPKLEWSGNQMPFYYQTYMSCFGMVEPILFPVLKLNGKTSLDRFIYIYIYIYIINF